ncbi:DegT/DnrJ/EryC1/StrS family aminotransferase [candidate division WOR-3 bacterium]|nr:DegT/DnrJ/EryC1/StrS family aminotransferase [candidate division WOR-3 bacterium]
MIPLVDLRAQYEEVKDEMLGLWNEVLDSMYLYLGKNVQEFEKEFASYNNVKYCIGVGSGTEALLFALKVVGVGEEDEVIAPSHTFFATIEAVIHAGAYPVMLDIDTRSYTLSVDDTREYIEENCTKEKEGLRDGKTGKILKAIIPVHIYGYPADMDGFNEIARKYGLFIIEDAAQAHGAKYKNKRTGTLGDLAAFSFYFSKNLGAFGEAGGVTTNSDEYAQVVKRLREHGQNGKYCHEFVGFNSRLDELQAVVLRCKLKLLDEWNERRRKIAHFYNEALKDLPVVIPEEAKDVFHVYHLYVIRSEKRDELFEHLKRNGIGCGMHYPVPIHLQQAMKGNGYKRGDLPKTEKISGEILSLPMYPHLTKEKAGKVVETIRNFYK